MIDLSPSADRPAGRIHAFRTILNNTVAHLGAVVLALGIAVIGTSIPGDALAQSASVDTSKLMRVGKLKPLVIGNENAKITIVEYASMTCPHCATFHVNTLPKIKKKYIDTGKAKLVFREFPLDNLAAGAAMLARCAPNNDIALKMIDTMMKRQRSWAFVRSNPLPPLFKIAKQFGFTQKRFDKCLTDQSLLTNLTKQRYRASNEFGVNSTPHFFVNGKRLRTGSLKEFDKAIADAQ